MEIFLNIIQYIPLIGALVFLAWFGISFVINFFTAPSEQQIANILEWLKIAVVNAEKEFGKGTGVLKLRAVYEAAIIKFPWVARYISFEKFASWVDISLEWMKQEIDKNKAIEHYINSD